MTRILFLLLTCLSVSPLVAQNPKKSAAKSDPILRIPMEPAYWQYDSTRAEFITHRSVKAIRNKPKTAYQVFLKNHTFTEGTIEFDVELVGMGFPGISFRMSPDQKYGENFYIRSFGPVTPEVRWTIQYAPIVDGVSMWDLADEYQTGATIHQEGWNHVKLVVADRKMNVYVNDMTHPALHVPYLEASTTSGGISLSGNVIYANLTVDPRRPAELGTEPTYPPLATDTRYLRHWQATGPINFPFGREPIYPLPSMYGTLAKSEVPDSTARWEAVDANRRGIVNLTPLYGSTERDGRRLAWLKTTIYSDKAQEKTLNLGFSDEVWLLVNGQITYVGKNYFGTPNAKNDGRCTIENATIRLPLKQGKNEVLIGLANYFYGWGIIARLADTDGIRF